ncbi:3-deoxy-7-phosphoheptulonate synthase [Parafannyhessea umbonata]|uniref:3-deoxy-D-arabinoheptulosonate-7-phosphate synthase n=1 Tax=Parafannyhessea umbonata TaxID=604330 RepID=A0A1G6L435_9ACTN|nr:3-deoxy-7-phosphoheptulonate synthase [Parafannyhessea umbonata]MDD6566676.1 3-deoxy-7-phosphoheptulonate synthase [Parafannyhessea umbonata]SDC37505.1 3-deoxy-D-arabinoheptulosonate-7-phosphate synthase [Parafannyhessea umbonata]
MIAIVKDSATPEQLSHFVRWIEDRGFKTNVSKGENETIVGIIGDTTQIDPFLLESMDIIDQVRRVSEPFKKANRKFHPEDTVVDCGHGVLVGGGNFQVIAGPCSVEGKGLIDIARAVKRSGATMLRGGAYKPRTSPYSYQGMGEKGLDILLEASAELDMPVVTEVMDPRDVQLFLDKGIDVMQIGARNAQNFPLLREVGKTRTPVLLKRGMSETIDELLMGAEYIMSEGNPNVILCERGIRTFETRTRNTFDVNAIPVVHHLSHLPIIGDPSHSTGYTRYVRPAAYAATAAGADGLEIEVHDNPSQAWSDGAQALTPAQFDDAMRRIRVIREAICQDLDEGGVEA